ncbi:nuclear transport factor 2 family protein [Herbiconiux moechotypicola]|uniref:SnoaL-like domain-containing protein n=1 Tax=Herbiconiux moechotypicola TaxID=637393 RepID=A0ABN3DFM7_9MICO|nr:nuclear transport factor 2 family protein [Herbiconiux moechotypicola]MCS5729273.1 nuclear transport factor 2 family protein [Herbiconiux moechotypicola]
MDETRAAELEQRLAMLEDESALTRLLDEYVGHWDHKRWGGMAALLTEDAELRSAWSTIRGRESILSEVGETLDAVPVLYHLLTNLTVRVDGDEAEGTSSLLEVHLGRAGDPRSVDSMFGGRYLWRFVRSEGLWRIAVIDYELVWSSGPNTLGVFSPTAS